MANYLYVFRGGVMANSPEEMQKSMQKWVAWMDSLGKAGHLKGGEPLAREGKVLRGQKKSVTDGPYAESKDVVGGYLLVIAKSLDEATELARGCPIFENETGSVEVRPIQQM
jgi:hypothetical protein